MGKKEQRYCEKMNGGSVQVSRYVLLSSTVAMRRKIRHNEKLWKKNYVRDTSSDYIQFHASSALTCNKCIKGYLGQEGGGAVVVVQSANEVGVPVAQVREGPGGRHEPAEAAVGAAHHPDLM